MRFMRRTSYEFRTICHDNPASNWPTDMPASISNEAENKSTVDSTDVTRRVIAELRVLSNNEVTRQVEQLNRKHLLIDAELLLYLSARQANDSRKSSIELVDS